MLKAGIAIPQRANFCGFMPTVRVGWIFGKPLFFRPFLAFHVHASHIPESVRSPLLYPAELWAPRGDTVYRQTDLQTSRTRLWRPLDTEWPPTVCSTILAQVARSGFP